MLKLILYGTFIIACGVSMLIAPEYVSNTLTASRGSFYFYSTKFCFIRDCALNSVDSTYGIITFPTRIHSNEFDRVTFDLQQNEYLDINMVTPHPCFYYGWSLYLMDRWFDYTHHQYGASINDTLNSFEIHSQLATDTPFQKEIRLFVSHNTDILEDLREFHKKDKSVFYMTWNAFHPSIVPYNATGDRLTMFFRILMPDDIALLDKYINSAPVTVYRYRVNQYKIDEFSQKPLGIWRERSADGVNENRALGTDFAQFSRDMQNIVQQHARKNNRIPLVSLPHRNSINYDNGWDCILYKKQCWADNRDTIYIGTGFEKDKDAVGFPLKNESLILIVGVNHTHFSNSLYNSLQLYDYTNEQGFYSFHGFDNFYQQSRTYKNSCKTIYETFTHNGYNFRTEQFYCVLMSREDFDYWKFPPDVKDFYKQITASELPETNLFNTVERSYLQNQLSISAIHQNLIFPSGIIFY